MSSFCPTITQTLAQTLTYCATCPGGLAAPLPVATVSNPTSTYTTTVQTFCPTGLAPATYTVYQSCPCKAPAAATAPPPGFTTTVATCTSCGSKPITATLTVPGSSATCIGAGCAPIPTQNGTYVSGPIGPPAAGSMGAALGTTVVNSAAATSAKPSASGKPGAVSQIGDGQPQGPTSAAPAGAAGTPVASPSAARFTGDASSTFGSPKRLALGVAVAISFVLHML